MKFNAKGFEAALDPSVSCGAMKGVQNFGIQVSRAWFGCRDYVTESFTHVYINHHAVKECLGYQFCISESVLNRSAQPSFANDRSAALISAQAPPRFKPNLLMLSEP